MKHRKMRFLIFFVLSEIRNKMGNLLWFCLGMVAGQAICKNLKHKVYHTVRWRNEKNEYAIKLSYPTELVIDKSTIGKH